MYFVPKYIGPMLCCGLLGFGNHGLPIKIPVFPLLLLSFFSLLFRIVCTSHIHYIHVDHDLDLTRLDRLGPALRTRLLCDQYVLYSLLFIHLVL